MFLHVYRSSKLLKTRNPCTFRLGGFTVCGFEHCILILRVRRSIRCSCLPSLRAEDRRQPSSLHVRLHDSETCATHSHGWVRRALCTLHPAVSCRPWTMRPWERLLKSELCSFAGITLRSEDLENECTRETEVRTWLCTRLYYSMHAQSLTCQHGNPRRCCAEISGDALEVRKLINWMGAAKSMSGLAHTGWATKNIA